MTARTKNADFRRKPQIFADSPFLLEISAFGGRRKPQKTADFRRKHKIFAENRRKPQIGLHHLRSVTFSSALHSPPSASPPPIKRVPNCTGTFKAPGFWSVAQAGCLGAVNFSFRKELTGRLTGHLAGHLTIGTLALEREELGP